MTSAARAAEEKGLGLLVRKALRYLDAKKTATPAVFLLPDAEMRRLKARFLKRRIKRGEADVLSFPEPSRFPHPESPSRVLGEICINRDLRNDSRERRGRLVFHGLLHLLGYTHKGKNDILKMQKLERKLEKKFFGKWLQA